MQQATDFETLSQAHQFQVLRYLQMTGSDNIQQAIIHLQRFNMNATQAINSKYQNVQQNLYEEDRFNNNNNNLTRQQQQELVKYNNHLRQVYITTSSPWYIIKYYGGMAQRIAKGLTQCIMPQCIRKVVFYSKFDKIYKDESRVELFDRGLDDAFKKGIFDQKLLAIIVSDTTKSGEITQLLNSTQQVVKLLSTRIVTTGIIKNSNQHKKLKSQSFSPSVIFAYQTIFQEIKIISTNKPNEITQSKIKQVINKYRAERRKQKNIIIRYKNKILSRYNGGEQEMEEEIPESNTYQYDRLIVQQQRAEYEQASNIRKESLQKEQYERIRKQSLAEERKARKISIPQQPTQGDIIVCNFRCPNGKRIDRRFDKNQKIQLLYNWVQTNEQIEFEQQDRNFELLRGYPPQPMKDKMQMKISQVIQEDRQVILIRQL